MPKIKPSQVASILKQVNTATYRAVIKGARAGALAGERHIKPKTVVDRGDLRDGWRVSPRRAVKRAPEIEAAHLLNDAPHAGIVEGGARPHGVSPEGRESIAGWVRRHWPGAGKAEVDRITWGIVRKLKKVGQKPTWFVRNELDTLRDLAGAEIDTAVSAVAKRPPTGEKRSS